MSAKKWGAVDARYHIAMCRPQDAPPYDTESVVPMTEDEKAYIDSRFPLVAPSGDMFQIDGAEIEREWEAYEAARRAERAQRLGIVIMVGITVVSLLVGIWIGRALW